MNLLQVKVDDKLKDAIKKKAEAYGVPSTSLVRIVLVKAFLDVPENPGNVFNSKRDNKGKGIKINDLLSQL